MADKIRLERDYGAEYEPTDSEDDYSEEEKELLKEARKGRESQSSSKELMAFADTDSDEEDDENENENSDDDDDDDDVKGFIEDSDIEGADDDDDDGVPDAMDWGAKNKNYYNTDFVDPDYSSYTQEQEVLAKQEEEEAIEIQKRMAKRIGEKNFLLDDDDLIGEYDVDSEGEPSTEITTVKSDFSGLTQRDKQMLFKKDSPEFDPLVTDFQILMSDVENLHTPILQFTNDHKVPKIPALEFTQTYRNIALTYCTNISFYLMLKAKRVNIENHPIVEKLAQLKEALLKLQDKYDNIIRPQLEALLERIVDGDEFEVLDVDTEKKIVRKPKTKTKLSILEQYNKDDEIVKENEILEEKNAAVPNTSDEEDEEEDEKDGDDELDENERRGITYQIAKNKGLTPHRKKEARNPRVKHRSKFRKALIRRKGAVRTVRTETKRYGGEISGIKSSVVKSVKFKT